MIKYTLEENGVIWYEENGVRVSFLPDESNSDYQRYLNPEAEQSTPIVIDEAKTK
jgi:hypothetical protein